MTRQDETTGTGVSNGGTVSASVETRHEDDVHILVDNGAGGAPASHDITVDVEDGNGTAMQYDSKTGITARSHDYDAVSDKMVVTLTNQSGGAADFRVRIVADE